MRLSIDDSDDGYAAWLAIDKEKYTIDVWVDDVKVKGCITADENRCCALVMCVDDRGYYIQEGDGVKTEWTYGNVDIVISPRAKAL